MKPLSARLTLLAALLTGAVNSQAAAPAQSTQSILDFVRQFLLSNPDLQRRPEVMVQPGHLDSRLQLSQCSQALEATLAPGAQLIGKTTVGVSCAAPTPWTLYVTAQVSVYDMVYQTARPLPRDHIITESDLLAVKLDLGSLNRGYYLNKQDLIGKQTRRPLAQNQILNPGAIKAPRLIKRGEQVALLANSAGFSIRMAGQALSDGHEGEQIRVKNLSSNRIVEGVVTAQGVVTVMAN